MARIPIDIIIQKIKEKTGLSEKEISRKIKDKLDILSGLISEEGAAHILANELGVKVYEETGKLQIKNIMPGMKSVEVSGKVIKIYEPKSFESEVRKGKLCSFLIGDQTGIVRVVAWNDKVDLITGIKENDIVKIQNCYSKENNGRVELHMGNRSTLEILPNEKMENFSDIGKAVRKKISDLGENEDNVEVLGTIVQVFDPRFFEICPQCGKRAQKKEGGFYCDNHQSIEPAYGYVLNLLLDDGSDSIRVILWRSQAQRLLNMQEEEILKRRESFFEDVKNDLLGRIVKFVGRTKKNQMFERIEFIPQFVFLEPNPDEEIEKIKREVEKAEREKASQTEEHVDKEELKEEIEEVAEISLGTERGDSSSNDDIEMEDITEIEEIEDLGKLDEI